MLNDETKVFNQKPHKPANKTRYFFKSNRKTMDHTIIIGEDMPISTAKANSDWGEMDCKEMR